MILVANFNYCSVSYYRENYKCRLTMLKKELAFAENERKTLISAIKSGENAKIKGIFIAPEYFFTTTDAGYERNFSQNGYGCKSSQIKESYTKKIQCELAKLSKEYSNWLIIPGTIASKKDRFRKSELISEADYKKSKTERGVSYDMNSYNLYSLKQYRGRLEKYVDCNGSHGSTEFAKLHARNSRDEKNEQIRENLVNKVARNTAYVYFNGERIFKYHKQTDYHEVFDPLREKMLFLAGNKDGNFTHDKLNYGIEICADHHKGLLKQQNQYLDIHIILSDHVDNEPAKFQVKNGGHVLHASTNENSRCCLYNDNGTYKPLPLIKNKYTLIFPKINSEQSTKVLSKFDHNKLFGYWKKYIPLSFKTT